MNAEDLANVFDPRKDIGKGDFKENWEVTESLGFWDEEENKEFDKAEGRWVALGRKGKILSSLLWAWNKAETHPSNNVSVVLSCFYYVFLPLIGLTIWLLLKTHLLHSKVLILHCRTQGLRQKMSGSQELSFAHLGQENIK